MKNNYLAVKRVTYIIVCNRTKINILTLYGNTDYWCMRLVTILHYNMFVGGVATRR